MIVPTYETTAREHEIIINNQRKEIERLKEELEKLNGELRRYKSIVYLCEKVKDCDKE